jgi:hypothetical protein
MVHLPIPQLQEEKITMDLPKLAGLVTGGAFVMGLLINFGYFASLNLDLFPLLSYKDHLEVLIFFAPFIALPTGVALSIRKKLSRRLVATAVAMIATILVISLAMMRRPLLDSQRVSDTAIMLLLVLFSTFTLGYFTAVLAGYVWDAFVPATETVRPPAVAKSSMSAWTEQTIAVICMTFMAIVLGGASGRFQSIWSNFDTEITRSGESAAQLDRQNARVVRAIDAGLLLVFQNTPDRLTFVRYEAIKSMSRPVGSELILGAPSPETSTKAQPRK